MRLRMKRKKGRVDHELDVRCKVYENGRVAADPETLRLLAQFSEREISKATVEGVRFSNLGQLFACANSGGL